MNTAQVQLQFICRGGVFRSRLAEAYTRSKKSTGLQVSSSGVDADIYPGDYLSPFAAVALRQAGLFEFVTPTRQVTTQELLDASNVLVFLDPTVAADVQARFELRDQKTVTWDVKDIENYAVVDPTEQQKEMIAIKTLRHIESLVDGLLRDMQVPD